MARAEKRSFVLHYDLEEQTELLSDAQLGRLMRAVFGYEIRGEFPEFEDDKMLLMSFQFVKTALDINRQKYEERCEQNRHNVNQRYKKEKEQNAENESNNFKSSPVQEESQDRGSDVPF